MRDDVREFRPEHWVFWLICQHDLSMDRKHSQTSKDLVNWELDLGVRTLHQSHHDADIFRLRLAHSDTRHTSKTKDSAEVASISQRLSLPATPFPLALGGEGPACLSSSPVPTMMRSTPTPDRGPHTRSAVAVSRLRNARRAASKVRVVLKSDVGCAVRGRITSSR